MLVEVEVDVGGWGWKLMLDGSRSWKMEVDVGWKLMLEV